MEYEKIVKNIAQMINDASTRKFPIVESRIEEHCNDIGQEIMLLLAHVIGQKTTDFRHYAFNTTTPVGKNHCNVFKV